MTKGTHDNDNDENDVYPFKHIAAATADVLRFLFPEKPPGEQHETQERLAQRHEEEPDDKFQSGHIGMSWRGDAA